MPVTLAQAQNFKPAIKWLWEIRFAGNSRLKDLDTPIHAISFTPPEKFIGTRSRFNMGGYLNLPEHVNINAFDIEFLESENYDVTEFLSDWQLLIVDNNRNYGLPSDYFADLNFKAFNDKGEEKLKGEVVGVWPSQKNPPQFSLESGLITFGCSFACFDSSYNKSTFADIANIT